MEKDEEAYVLSDILDNDNLLPNEVVFHWRGGLHLISCHVVSVMPGLSLAAQFRKVAVFVAWHPMHYYTAAASLGQAVHILLSCCISHVLQCKEAQVSSAHF